MTPLVFAFGAGVLATVNPCGFAMLPAFVAYYLGDPDDPGQRRAPLTARLAQGFSVGLAVSGGFAAVFTVIGLLVSVGLRSLVQVVPWAAVAIGAVLTVLGVALLAGRHVGLGVGRQFGPGAGRGYRRMVLFGSGYAVASLSCTLAVLLAVVAQAVATANPLQMIGVFAAYAAGAATVLVALSVSAAVAKAAVARGVRRLLPLAGRLGGGVLVASGLYLVAYWLPLLSGSPTARPATGRFTEGVSAWLTAFLEAHQGGIAVAAVVLVLVGLGLAITLRRHARAGEASPDGALPPVDDCCASPGLLEELHAESVDHPVG